MGVINANNAANPLVIQPTGAGDATNGATGVWEVSNGGVLELAGGGDSFSSFGVIKALDLSRSPA
jgi:hypothetical protein